MTWLEATLTVDTNAYAAGDLIGKAASGTGVKSNPVTLALPDQDAWPKGSGFLIQHVGLIDLSKQNAATDVVFFHTEPTNSTLTDNSAAAIVAADLAFRIGTARVTEYDSYNATSAGEKVNCGLTGIAVGASLFAVLVSRGTPTYAAANNLILRVGLLRL